VKEAGTHQLRDAGTDASTSIHVKERQGGDESLRRLQIGDLRSLLLPGL
jgi:hypothetical protein